MTPEQTAGYLQERVVAALERQLNEGGRVSRDVRLKVLNPAISGKRQIDILITQGESPREIFTIVEVQKRRRKVGPDQINSWHRKMQEVGAHQLICVSETGYTSGAKQRANQVGPIIRLMTLSEIEDHLSANFPFLTMFSKPAYFCDFSRTLVESVHAKTPDGQWLSSPRDFDTSSSFISFPETDQWLTIPRFCEILFNWKQLGIVESFCADPNKDRILLTEGIAKMIHVRTRDRKIEQCQGFGIIFESVSVEEAKMTTINLEYRQVDAHALLWICAVKFSAIDHFDLEVHFILRRGPQDDYEIVAEEQYGEAIVVFSTDEKNIEVHRHPSVQVNHKESIER